MLVSRTHDKGVGFNVICLAKGVAGGLSADVKVTSVTPTLVAYYKDDGGSWTSHTIADSLTQLGTTGVFEFTVTDAEADHDEILFQFTGSGLHVHAIHSISNQLIQKGGRAIVFGKAQTGTLSTTVFTTDLSETTNGHYKGRTLYWISGNLKGQKATILLYTGTGGTITVSAMTEAPANTDEFVII